MVYNASKTERRTRREPAFERRLLILEILSVRRFATVQELADRFGVCKRTIQYDLDYLSSIIPVYSVRGKGGGFHVLEGWRNHHQYLTNDQEDLLLRLLPSLSLEDQAIIQEILSAFSLHQNH